MRSASVVSRLPLLRSSREQGNRSTAARRCAASGAGTQLQRTRRETVGLRTLVEQTLQRLQIQHLPRRSRKRDSRPYAGAAEDAYRTSGHDGSNRPDGYRLSAVRESISDLTERMNKMQAQLVDLNNTVKVMSAPPAAPPTGSPRARQWTGV